MDFVDWPFSKLDDYSDVGEMFDAHYKIVRAEKPKYAVAPDVDEFTTYTDVKAWADELGEYAETVIVVPKTIHPKEVARRFRVGMPCQPRYGPTPWQWTEYSTCAEVHLLGGSPVKHAEIMKYHIPVESVDTTSPVKAARFGDYWNGSQWYNSTGGFYWCLKQSYRNMRRSMNPRREVWDPGTGTRIT
ncbi:DUF6610 family protein [Halarchaeum salinum]|uniref:Uncharacterized protein n=1 Tax=Halarchaeum salinum TaxID=489912 RepID=A0AAV3SB25_9EURY